MSIEKNRQDGCILLFQEGGFYRAYECSALDAIKNLHEFKATCKYYKALNTSVVSIGFPVTSLAKFVKENVVEQNEDMAIIKLSDNAIKTSKDEFLAWKEALPKVNDSSGPIPSQRQISEIYQKIQNYPIESRTPLQCMIFLSEIKNELMRKLSNS